MIEVEFIKDIPDLTYYTPSRIEPIIEGHKIALYDGKGKSRQWGRPRISSRVMYSDSNFLAAIVLYQTKHSKGHFYRYYFFDGQKIIKLPWTKLPVFYQVKVLDACEALGEKRIPGQLTRNTIYLVSTKHHPLFDLCQEQKKIICRGEFIGSKSPTPKNLQKLITLSGNEDVYDIADLYLIEVDPINPKILANGLKYAEHVIPVSIKGPVFPFVEYEKNDKINRRRFIC